MEVSFQNYWRQFEKQKIDDVNAEIFSLLPFHFKSGGFHIDPHPLIVESLSYPLCWYMLKKSTTALNKLFDQVKPEIVQRACATYKAVSKAVMHNFSNYSVYNH